MKCSADVVTACDRENDGCGFCPDHCIYANCAIHKPDIHKEMNKEYRCPYDGDKDECIITQGHAPSCQDGDSETGTLYWQCPHYPKWEEARKKAIAGRLGVDIQFIM